MDQNQQGGGQSRRGNFHRGRRGSDRRGHDRGPAPERRQPDAPPQAQPQRTGGEHVDVEQIMRDIRARIATRHGIELSNQQVQELAARRLEAILDPRTVRPGLLEQLRKSAGTPVREPDDRPVDPPYTFEASTLFDTHRGLLRFIRKLLRPILTLFFNPTPLVHALSVQSKLNIDAAARETEMARVQSEWNALHYELLRRVVTETARVSLELQSFALRVESLAGKVDFNERRVRGIEGAAHQPHQPRQGRSAERPAERPVERPVDRGPAVESHTPPPAPVAAAVESAPAAPIAGNGIAEGTAVTVPADGQRRRRRRRRGRRSGGGIAEGVMAAGSGAAGAAGGQDPGDLDDGPGGFEDEGADQAAEPVQTSEAEMTVAPTASAVFTAPDDRQDAHAPDAAIDAAIDTAPDPAPTEPGTPASAGEGPEPGRSES